MGVIMSETFDIDADQLGAVGPGATAHFHGFTSDEVIRLIQTLIDALQTAPLETMARDADGNVRVGDTVLSAAEVGTLRRLLADLPEDTPDDVRHQLGPATHHRMGGSDGTGRRPRRADRPGDGWRR